MSEVNMVGWWQMPGVAGEWQPPFPERSLGT